MYGSLDRGMMQLRVTTLPLKVFTQRKFVADFLFDRSWFLLAKTAKSRFVPPFLVLRGVTYTVQLWLVGKRVVNFLLMPAFTVILVEIVVFERG